MIITILRKPLEGSVADNALKHGCGAINIDDTRIGNIVQDTSKNGRSSDKHKSTVFQSGLKEDFEGKITTGRWPANFILTHKDGCELKGTKKVKSNGHFPKRQSSTPGTHGKMGDGWSGKVAPERHMGKEGNEKVADWVCVLDCPVQEIDRQSGTSRFFKQFSSTKDQNDSN